MYHSHLNADQRSFLMSLQSRLWSFLDNKPQGTITDSEFRQVVSMVEHLQLGVALARCTDDIGLHATFYARPPSPPKARWGTPRQPQAKEPVRMLCLIDSQLEEPQVEIEHHQKRQRFLDALFPLAVSRDNLAFRHRYQIGGCLDQEKLFLIDPLPVPPANELSKDDWRFFKALDIKLWHITMQKATSGRNRYTQQPTLTARDTISEQELATIVQLFSEDKIFLSWVVRTYGGMKVVVSTHPWSAIKDGAKRHVVYLDDWHMRTGYEEDALIYRKRCWDFFAPLFLSPQNIAHLEKYGLKIPTPPADI